MKNKGKLSITEKGTFNFVPNPMEFFSLTWVGGVMKQKSGIQTHAPPLKQGLEILLHMDLKLHDEKCDCCRSVKPTETQRKQSVKSWRKLFSLMMSVQ